jgi:hypothetical protein
MLVEKDTLFINTYFDHNPKIMETLRNFKPDNKGFQWIGVNRFNCTSHDCPHHEGLPLSRIYKSLFGNDDKINIEFYSGGQFAVSREKILENSKEFYSSIVKLLEYDISPIEGFVMERFHGVIFS